MEGKLFKMVEGYTLSLTGSIDDLYGISNKELADDHGLHKLSLENCEAIANGYDLEELVDEYAEDWKYTERIGFRDGFQKAIEILGDKKFSETELYRAFLINSAGNNTTLRNFFEQTVLPMFIDNEWDVEICCYIGNGDEESDSFKDRFVTNTGIPKLDENKCLILKRK